MYAWGFQVVVVADPRAELAKALGVDFDATGLLGNVRSKRCEFFMPVPCAAVLHRASGSQLSKQVFTNSELEALPSNC